MGTIRGGYFGLMVCAYELEGGRRGERQGEFKLRLSRTGVEACPSQQWVHVIQVFFGRL